ncbi:hypothetical protein [Mesorhizobium xinjiangense]|uniref:hypothetical protein n=1 Tax=Mesorhizobium xinjiangense TaxID=2678685 RepID=UPI0012EDCEF1|nr:hypothetical protein [Mesorhizobium xinjiangense]
MHAHQTTESEKRSVPLEAIEFELALNAENIRQSGFEASVRRALTRSSGSLLFLMPVSDIPHCQRIAAILAGKGAESQLLLVLLHSDGDSFHIETAEESALKPYANVAMSYRNVLERLAGGSEATTH